jgi:hypothetical protein
MLAPKPGEGNLTNIMQVRRSVNIRNNCLVCGEVLSLINPLVHVVNCMHKRLRHLCQRLMGLSTHNPTTQDSYSLYI